MSSQVEQGVVVDNGSAEPQTIRELLPSHFSMIENRQNLGLSVALNQGVDRLRSGPAIAWVLTLDQDSVVSADYVRCLLEKVDGLPGKDRVGLIAGTDRRSSTATRQLRRVNHVILSGSLVRFSLFDRAKYREDFFIDQIDHDFCFQIRAQGFEILRLDSPMFVHQLGSSKRIIGREIRYEASPRYYQLVRDSFTLFRELRFPLGAFVSQIVWNGLALSLAESPIRTISAIYRGMRDSLRRRPATHNVAVRGPN